MTDFSLENLSEETKRKIQQIQIYEQTFEQMLMEKRAMILELEELETCLKEIEKNNEDVFKILAGQYVIKSKKEKIKEEILNKKELFSLRIKKIEEQEREYSEQMEKIRKEIMKEINNTKI